MKDAPIIILDEATANVDPENEKELMEAVAELTHDKTVIMIAHRLKTVRHADQIFVVDHGEIVQQGTHDELVAVGALPPLRGGAAAGRRVEGLKKHNLKNMKRSSYQLLTDTSFSVYSLFPVIK